eukprot:8424600-Heterocapsa_arctica.AAC.1
MLEKVRAVERNRLRPKKQGQGQSEDAEPADPAIHRALQELAPAELQFMDGDVAGDHAMEGEEDYAMEGEVAPPADSVDQNELAAAMELERVEQVEPVEPVEPVERGGHGAGGAGQPSAGSGSRSMPAVDTPVPLGCTLTCLFEAGVAPRWMGVLPHGV